MDWQVNRAKELWQNWEKREMELSGIPEAADEHGRDISRQKYAYLKLGLYRISDTPSLHEQPYRDLIAVVCAKLQKQLYPNLVLRLAHRLRSRLYDKPRYLAAHRQLVAENTARLSEFFRCRGMDGYSGRLDDYLDYERDKLEVIVSGRIDGYRSMSVVQQLVKDGNGHYQPAGLQAGIYGSADPCDDLRVELEKGYGINMTQLANLLQGRAVLLFRDKAAGLPKDTWLTLSQGRDDTGTVVNRFAGDYGFSLKSELEKLASLTGLFRMTAADVLRELQQGGRFSLSGHHPKDKPFTLEADPGNMGVLIRDHQGREMGISELQASLRHVLPEKTAGPGLGTDQGKDKNNEPEQGLAI